MVEIGNSSQSQWKLYLPQLRVASQQTQGLADLRATEAEKGAPQSRLARTGDSDGWPRERQSRE